MFSAMTLSSGAGRGCGGVAALVQPVRIGRKEQWIFVKDAKGIGKSCTNITIAHGVAQNTTTILFKVVDRLQLFIHPATQHHQRTKTLASW
jgi:hypothetical protein